MFTLLPGAYEYRPLKRGVNGYDTYAHQTALLALGYDLGVWGADGYFGAATEKATRDAQTHWGLNKVDGIAGIATQRHEGGLLASIAGESYDLPHALAHGQIEHECGWQLGNYTTVYPNTGRRDLGALQQNLDPTVDNCFRAFNVPASIARYVSDPDRGMRPRYNRYKNFARVKRQPNPTRTAWELAAGSWNAPAVTDAWAKDARQTLPGYLLDYIAAVTAYVTDWPS